MEKIKQLNNLLINEPDDSFLNYALALEYIKIGKQEKADGVFEKLICFHPNYLPAYYHYGKLLEKRNRKDEAILQYKKGITLARNQKEQRTLAELMTALNELELEDLL